MGSFGGHADEASFFLLLGFWWMYNAFPGYIKAVWHGDDHFSRCSYRVAGKRKIPLEAILKIIFSVFGFTIEMIENRGVFVDSDHQFRGVSNLQHMSVFGVFIVHSIADLLVSLGAPLPHGYDRISGALAFAWYGMFLQYHSQSPEMEGMEKLIHILPATLTYLLALTFVVETVRPSWFVVHVTRIYAILVLGAWFLTVSFIMYKPLPFPGRLPNPSWDRHDMRNVHFLVAAFGFHLALVLLFITLVYMITVFVLKVKGQNRPHYYHVTMPDDDKTFP